MAENLNDIYEDIGSLKSRADSLDQRQKELELDVDKNLRREVVNLTGKIDELLEKIVEGKELAEEESADLKRRLKILEYGFDILEKKRIKRQKLLKNILTWSVRSLLVIIPAIIKVLSDNGYFSKFLRK